LLTGRVDLLMRKKLRRKFKLYGNSDETLRQCVMDLASYAGAFTKNSSELSLKTSKPQTVE